MRRAWQVSDTGICNCVYFFLSCHSLADPLQSSCVLRATSVLSCDLSHLQPNCGGVLSLFAMLHSSDFNECSSNPCQHGGKCIDRRDGFVCVCPVRYDGE